MCRVFLGQTQVIMAGMVQTEARIGQRRRVTTLSQLRLNPLRLNRLGSGNRELQTFRFAHHRDARGHANAIAGEQAMEVIDAVDRLSIESHDDIAGLNSRVGGGTPCLHRGNQDAARLNQAVRTNSEPW